MLHIATDGHKIFEVAIYNKAVKDRAENKQRHAYFEERWSRPQTRTVVARSEDEARELIAERFPPKEGFVIQSVYPGRY